MRKELIYEKKGALVCDLLAHKKDNESIMDRHRDGEAVGRYLLLLALKMWLDLPARRTTTVIISKTRLEYNEEDPCILDRIMWTNESKFTNNFTPPIF